MSGQSVLPTYQNDGVLESLIEKEPPKEYGVVASPDDSSIFSKKNKVKTGTIFVVALVISVFLLRTVLSPKQTEVYNNAGVSPDGFPGGLPSNSVQDVIASSDASSASIVYTAPDSITTDVEASYIIDVPAAETTTTVEEVNVETGAVDAVQPEPVAEPEPEPAPAAEPVAVTEPVIVTEPVVEEPAAEVIIAPVAVPVPDPTLAPVSPPTPVPSKEVVRPSMAPTAAMQITVAQLKKMRSDARLAPLSMSMYTDQNNWIKTFFSKYGLVGTRFTNKMSYKAPDPISTMTVEGNAASWMYATIYSDSTCGVGSGTMYSVAGIANNECLPIAGFGGDKGVALMMDCRSNGDVVMNAYNSQDCGGAPISSTILALANTCYAYSYSLSDTVTDTSVTTSVAFTCGNPNLENLVVSKFFIAETDSQAAINCGKSTAALTDAQIFEAYPTAPTCIPQLQSDGNAFSVSFSYNAETTAPYVTFFKGSDTCQLKTTASTASSGNMDLGSSCGVPTPTWVTTETSLGVYNRWSHHPSLEEQEQAAAETESETSDAATTDADATATTDAA